MVVERVFCPWCRLTSDPEFLAINGSSPITTIGGFSPWRAFVVFRNSRDSVVAVYNKFFYSTVPSTNVPGIYPDLLHVLDLAIYCDVIASAFLEWSDKAGQPFDGRSRDERLLKLYSRYLVWCRENRCPDSLTTFLFPYFFHKYISLLYIYIYKWKVKIQNSQHVDCAWRHLRNTSWWQS